MFRRKKKEPPPVESRYKWIEDDDPRNKFGIRFLDCRPITQTYTATTESMEIADSYVRLRSSSGIEYHHQDLAEFEKVEISLNYPLKAYEQGPLYKSEEMEYKWDIYLYNVTIFYTRSWGGELVYMTPFKHENESMTISEVYTSPENAKLGSHHLQNEIDFLIKTHLFKIMAPHPIPPNLVGEDDEIIAFSAFANWGRFGSFASNQDTSKLDLVYLSNTFKYEIKTEFKALNV